MSFDFKAKLELMPKSASDTNMLFAIPYAEYRGYVLIMDTLLLGHSFLLDGLTKGMDTVDGAAYNTIIKGVGGLNAILKSSGLDKLNVDIDLDALGNVGDALALTCVDYFGSIPQDLFNVFQDFKHRVNTKVKIGLPAGLVSGLAGELLRLKDDAMKAVLGSVIFEAAVSPLLVYEGFIRDNGIDTMIKRMEALERCMTNPKIGHRPKSDFMHPTERVLYSQHFKTKFMLNSKGQLSLKLFPGATTATKKAKMFNVIKKVQAFRITI
jgi:hypothetical protein